MKTINFSTIISIVFLIIGMNCSAQSAKKYYKTAKEYSKSGSFEEAVENYTKAIEINPKYIDAYIDRALAYEELEQLNEAADDYKTLSELQPNESNWFYKSASLYYKLNKYDEAFQLLNSAESIDSKDSKIYELKMRCNLILSNFKAALSDCDKAIKLNPTAENYYYRGLIHKKLENYSLSETDFTQSLKIDPNYLNSNIGLAISLFKQNKIDEALNAINGAIKTESKNKDALMTRSMIYRKKSDYQSAINDLSKLVLYYPKDAEVNYQRGLTYFENNQFTNAIADFNKALSIDSNHKLSIYKRANAYEKIGKENEAASDYDKLLSFKKSNLDTNYLYSMANERIYELKRENDSPVISIISEKSEPDNSISVSGNIIETSIKIGVTDKSEISWLTIDNRNIKFNPDSLANGITVNINIKNKSSIIVECEDIYKNKTHKEFRLIKTESEAPTISILNPYVSEKNEVLIDTKITVLSLEGKVTDNSKIASIEINGIAAIYDKEEINPKFKVSLDLNNLDKINIEVKDIHNNTVAKTYKINRSAVEANANPMGITWVVFIENSDYKKFTSFDGPEKDVNLMKNALSKYQIDNILHKRNMTKQQMERFFSVELRDLVKENGVNSVLIWYAGLGKYIKDKSYWIPTDAKRDDESGYFNINSLKSSMQAYSSNITHTLLVTDACETGPTFYLSMRALPTERDCNSAKATKFKSSQVFTSSGYEQADDNSQFTKTFANSLNFNNDGCIPIDKIVFKVSTQVQKSSSQKPKFGKISGFEDENGTFIFIKK